MFLKVGLKDVFIGLWARKFKIVSIALVALLVAIINVCVSLNLFSGKKKNSENTDVYTHTITFVIGTTVKSENFDSYDQTGKIKSAVVSLLSNDSLAGYLQQNVKAEKELSNYLLPFSSKVYDGVVTDKNIVSICKSISVDGAGDNSTVRVAFNCESEKLGTDVANCIENYAKSVCSKFENATIITMNKNVYLSEQSIMNSSVISKRALTVAVIKKFILFAVIFEGIYIIIAIAEMMIRPVINSKNDFEYFSIENVWEI